MNQTIITAVYDGGVLRPLEALDLAAGQPVRLQLVEGDDDSAMQRPPASSSLTSVGYLPKSEALEIEFHDGSVYLYFGVPASVYDELAQAESRGRYFNAHVRNEYATRKTR
ncbi:KTSC domain-containing protein [Promineifilum sp.]|uniref:KTSC domain-containing protein n=1 Tax=Promineifilum sp. TaxID=2664178 RepID=UPI0035B4289D